jgi:hypothetical protein
MGCLGSMPSSTPKLSPSVDLKKTSAECPSGETIEQICGVKLRSITFEDGNFCDYTTTDSVHYMFAHLNLNLEERKKDLKEDSIPYTEINFASGAIYYEKTEVIGEYILDFSNNGKNYLVSRTVIEPTKIDKTFVHCNTVNKLEELANSYITKISSK